jgi:hypothetical protein
MKSMKLLKGNKAKSDASLAKTRSAQRVSGEVRETTNPCHEKHEVLEGRKIPKASPEGALRRRGEKQHLKQRRRMRILRMKP